MRVGYIRVSTEEQNEARQVAALEPYNIDRIFKEKKSGKNTERSELQAMLEFIREGDEVYVCDFSRLSRSVTDFYSLTKRFEEKKVKLVSLKENLDTSSATGKMMIGIIAVINEFERENMLERQRDGIAVAKAEGRYKGGKPKDLPDLNLLYEEWKKGNITASASARQLGVTRATFYNRVKQLELQQAIDNVEIEEEADEQDEAEEGGNQICE